MFYNIVFDGNYTVFMIGWQKIFSYMFCREDVADLGLVYPIFTKFNSRDLVV